MRGLRSLIILVVIAIPLGYFVYRDYHRPAGSDDPKRDKVFAVDADKIEEITIREESGTETRLRKSGSEWQIVSPVTAASDSSEVSGITSNLSTLEVQRIVDENPPDLKEYGLDQPRMHVSFKVGDEQHTLLIGAKTPPGSDLYAKRASESRVFLIPAYLESTFNKKTFDLRDKSAVKIDRDKLDALEIAAGGRSIRFTKPSGEWRLAAPVDARADFSGVESLISRLTSLQMKSIAAETESPDAKKFGLDKPAATVRFNTGSSQATLVFGSAAEEGSVYAKDLSRPLVFTVDAAVLDELKKDSSEYRQKDLFDARSFNSTHLQLTHGGQTHVFEKTKVKNKEGQEEEKWRQTAPQPRDLDQPTFDTLLSAVTGVRATGFVDAAVAAKALAAPEMTVSLRFDEGKKEDRVTFARSGTEAFAARAGEPGAARIEASSLDSIIKALQELK